ncbi:MAG: PKD domain-containing protein, partial [Candidatus Desantisbacteria bacterium]
GTLPQFSWIDTTTTTGLQGTTCYYVVQAVDACGNEAVASNVANARVSDIDAPTGTIIINNNDIYATSRDVTLNITVSDNIDTPNNIYMDLMEGTGTFAGNWVQYVSVRSFHLSSANDGTKTIYVRFKDSSNNISMSTSTITYGTETGIIADSITLDTTPPTGTIVINNGDTYATSTNGSLTITITSGTDNLTGTYTHTLSFANDSPEAWSNPITLIGTNGTTSTWTLSSGDGIKYVFCKITDAAGNEAIIKDDIILDTEGGTGVSVVINEASKYTKSQTVNLTLYSEAADTAQMKIWGDISPTIDWTTYATTYTGTLTATNGTKTVYAQFRDDAFNTSTTAQDTILLDTTAPVATYTVNPSSATVELGNLISWDASNSYDTVTTEALTYFWEFGDGNFAQGVKVSHQYTKCGTYIGTLTVTDILGWTTSISIYGTVNDVTPPTITDIQNTAPTTGDNVTITAKVTDNVINMLQGTIALYGTQADGLTTFSTTMSYDDALLKATGVVTMLSTITGTAKYYIVATDTSGNAYTTPEQTMTVTDNDAPTATTNLTATPVAGSSSIALTASTTDNVSTQANLRYDIYRGITQTFNVENGSRIATSVAPTGVSLAYTDTTTTEGTEYWYVVIAIDEAGNRSAESNRDSATANDITAPTITDIQNTAPTTGDNVT